MDEEKIIQSSGKLKFNFANKANEVRVRNLLSKYDETYNIWILNDELELVPLDNTDISINTFFKRLDELKSVLNVNYCTVNDGKLKFITENNIYTIIIKNNQLIHFSKETITPNISLSHFINKELIFATITSLIVLYNMFKYIKS